MLSTIDVKPHELDLLIGLAQNITAVASESPDEFCRQARDLSEKIPVRIKLMLRHFIKHNSPTGFFLIRGLYTDPSLPPTPPTNIHKVGENTIMAKIQAIMVHFMGGDMIAYEAEGYGRLFQDVVPDKAMANNQTSIGSLTELEIHTEQAFSKLRPDLLSLACLRGDEAAITYILPLDTILDHLTVTEIEHLKQPLWYTGVDLSFKLNGHDFIDGDIRGPMSILGSDEPTTLVFDQDLMYGVDDVADGLLRKIVDIYYTHRIGHVLKPGEIMIVDNRFAVHGRSPFFPRYDGSDRFLVRCFAALDYERSAYARIGRTVGAIYS
jgi:L-asparagine oxygenase